MKSPNLRGAQRSIARCAWTRSGAPAGRILGRNGFRNPKPRRIGRRQKPQGERGGNREATHDGERAFRTIKTVDLKVRPIHHRTADRVRAHIFLCMLAYYVEWHMREAWRALTFADTDLAAKAVRDPVAPAKRSKSALLKAARRTLDDGTPVNSFSTLMGHLLTIVRNTCRTANAGSDAPTFEITTTPNPAQLRALGLIEAISL